MKRRKGKAWAQSRKDTLRRDTVAWAGGLTSEEFSGKRKDWVLKVRGWAIREPARTLQGSGREGLVATGGNNARGLRCEEQGLLPGPQG